ncbi:p53-like transcription factor [Mucor lusitanicus]
MEQKSHIITEQVFGSSRKIQFIGLSAPTNTTQTTRPTSMDTLLSAIDHHHHHQQHHQYRSTNQRQLHRSEIVKETSSASASSSSSSAHQSMSIESLLDNNQFQHHRQSQSASTNEVSIASLLTSDNTSNHKRRWDYQQSQTTKRLSKKPKDSSNNNERHKTIITCLHASVAQKSYGSEKRFLCPPPIVQIKSPSNSTITNEQRAEKMQLSMSVICENGDRILEQRSMLDENQSGSFKYLHVTGTAKAKQFNLKVDLLPNTMATETTTTTAAATSTPPPSDPQPLASFISKPISIISKPSKRRQKQEMYPHTVRTKYMTSSSNMLCAKNTTWSPFDIIIVNQPKLPQPHKLPTRQQMTTTVSGRYTSRIQLAHPPPPPPPSAHHAQQQQNKMPIHVTYGTEIILRDSQTGVTSPSLIIRKVDKGRIAQCAYGPVSQMQKIALQLASTIDTQPIYLSAAGSMNDNSVSASPSSSATDSSNGHGSNTWLDYSPSRLVQPEKMTLELSYEEVDDYLCWTIVGINKFEYDYYENESFQGNQQDITDVAEFKPEASATATTTATAAAAAAVTVDATTAHTPPPSPPRHITPFPMLTTIEYQHDHHTLNVVGQHLIQAAPVPRLLDLWLGTHGPLVTRISQPPQPHTPHETHWSVQLPPTQDLLVANHDMLVTHADGRRNLELALLLVRQDGLVYHTGKALSCDVLDDSGRWTVVPASSSSATTPSSSSSSS